MFDLFYRLLGLVTKNKTIILYVSVVLAFLLVIYIAWNKFNMLSPDNNLPNDLDYQLDNFRTELNYLKRGQDSVNNKIQNISSKLKQTESGHQFRGQTISNTVPFNRSDVENAAILHLAGGHILDNLSASENHSPVVKHHEPELLPSESEQDESLKSENLCLKGIENKKCVEEIEEEEEAELVPRKKIILRKK